MTAFFDTNILVYAQTKEPQREKALALVLGGGVVSVQVLTEFVNVLRRKLRLDWAEIEEARNDMLVVFPDPVPLTLALHQAAVALARDHMVNIYDAQIIAAAQHAGCSILYSEDLQHGRRFGGVEIVNPFL